MDQRIKLRKKLIEVALPLDTINAASAREKSIRHGHPSTLHLWWARRPLSAARAVIFAQMVDDPSSHPEQFSTEEAQEAERQRLFGLVEQLVQWENTTNEEILEQARKEIWKSWRITCVDNQNHPRAKELFDPEKLPMFHDPFAGGGSLPLEAQRLGLESYASDLNPVAVLICKAMIEIPTKFAGLPPVNPKSKNDKHLFGKSWCGPEGLAEDVLYYGRRLFDEAERRIGNLYPKVQITPDMAKERPDLRAYVGNNLTVIAWLWTRTVKSPNPAFANVDVPLATTFMLGTKPGKEAFVDPVLEKDGYRFFVRVERPTNAEGVKRGTKSGGSGSSFLCLMSGTPIPFEYLRAEAKAGRMGTRLMAIVAEGEGRRLYLSPTPELESIAKNAHPQGVPETELPKKALGFRIQEYGMTLWQDLFTARQLVTLMTLCDLVQQVRQLVRGDALADNNESAAAEARAAAYADAVAMYLGIAVSRYSNAASAMCTWNPGEKKEDIRFTFSRQALAMTWDFAEGNPFSDSSGNLRDTCETWIYKALMWLPRRARAGTSRQADAAMQSLYLDTIVSTDPPYFNNIGYADLSDFFYLWLRPSLKAVLPDLFATLAVPKAEELIATPYRHDTKDEAEAFFLDGMTRAMHSIVGEAHPAFPVTVYYAFKQAESDGDDGMINTAWDTFLKAVIIAGFSISGTLPIRTERGARSVSIGTNALASSIVLVCRPRGPDAPTVSRREFLAALRTQLPLALKHLQRSNIAPVDLAQAAIGPGMEVYTRYACVIGADGKPLSVREALALINQTLDEVLAEQESDFDADSRWALAWFEQMGFEDGDYGIAETLSKAKNTSVSRIAEARIIISKGGKVRLLKPNELLPDWDPAGESSVTAWKSVHHLIRTLEAGGENGAADLVAKVGSKAEISRELAYRLYAICERKKRAQEALLYNSLVQSWPEIIRLAREHADSSEVQTQLFSQE